VWTELLSPYSPHRVNINFRGTSTNSITIKKIKLHNLILDLCLVLVKESSNLYIHSFILTGGDIKDIVGHKIVQIYI